jgi:hypothetical protein
MTLNQSFLETLHRVLQYFGQQKWNKFELIFTTIIFEKTPDNF